MEKGTVINRLCYKCGKTYTYTVGASEEANKGNKWRLCAECHKDRSRPWTCPCGEHFKGRNALMEHRRTVRANGGWCGVFYNTMDFRCPVCGKLISKAHENNRPSECIRNHSCKGLKEFAKYKISIATLYNIKEKLEKLEKYETDNYYEVLTENIMQTIWLQDRLGESKDFKIQSIEINQYVIILAIAELKMFFIFDMVSSHLIEKWNHALPILGWQGVEINWTDCILGKNDFETKVESAIKDRINHLQNKEDNN